MKKDDYNFELDGMDQQVEEEEIKLMTEEEERKAEAELLFWVQGIGDVKSIAGSDVYTKKEGCEDCIISIIKLLKYESNKQPFVRQTLGKWNILQSTLSPLFTIHTQDKKLAFQTLMLFVQLTELPHK